MISPSERMARAAMHARMPSPAAMKKASRAFFWLSAFYLVYCARPEDWIPGLKYVPLAKITALFAFLGLLATMGKTQRKLKDLPREAYYLLALIGVLSLSAVLSPVWKGGALSHTLDFAKVFVAWVLTFLLVTNFASFKRIVFIQAVSVVVISAVSVVLGRDHPRLEGVVGGIYSNPNDLAFAIVLTLPFCLAFLLTAKGALRKLAWTTGILILGLTLMLTASRAGMITLTVSGAVVLYHFGIRGRRLYLVVAAVLGTVLLFAVAGGPLMRRTMAITGSSGSEEEDKAHNSFEARKELMGEALKCIAHYPILGVGARNFQVYSGTWHEVHMTYLQIAADGGIPSLVLYLLFFSRAFVNLRKLRKRKDLDVYTTLFIGGLHSSMIGFVVGALFAPEAYQLFPYFSVAYTSALVATIAEQDRAAGAVVDRPRALNRFGDLLADYRKPDPVSFVR